MGDKLITKFWSFNLKVQKQSGNFKRRIFKPVLGVLVLVLGLGCFVRTCLGPDPKDGEFFQGEKRACFFD